MNHLNKGARVVNHMIEKATAMNYMNAEKDEPY